MKIALITDLHAEENFPLENGAKPWGNWEIILNDVQSRGIKKTIFLGDIGSKVAHQRFLETLAPFEFKFILGNHDRFSEITETIKPNYIGDKNEWHWSEEDDWFKKIYLDSSTDKISQGQLDWLQFEVQTEKPVLLFIHHPILQTNTTPQLEFPLTGADKVKEILLTHSQPVHIFNGHLHLDDHITAGNIHQIVTPSASIQIKRNSEKAEVENIGFAYRILDIHEHQVDSKVIWFDKDHN